MNSQRVTPRTTHRARIVPAAAVRRDVCERKRVVIEFRTSVGGIGKVAEDVMENIAYVYRLLFSKSVKLFIL